MWNKKKKLSNVHVSALKGYAFQGRKQITQKLANKIHLKHLQIAKRVGWVIVTPDLAQ